jgi:hypothetical protein
VNDSFSHRQKLLSGEEHSVLATLGATRGGASDPTGSRTGGGGPVRGVQPGDGKPEFLVQNLAV